MKRLAHAVPNFGSSIVTVHQALALRKNEPEEWEGKPFYDIISLRPMVPVNRGEKSSSFAFLGGGGNGHGQGSKGIAHEFVQEYVCKLRQWNVRVFGKEYNLTIDSSVDEWGVTDPLHGKNYYIDCLLNLAPDSDLYIESGGRIGIEVTDCHPTGYAKKKSLTRAGLIVFEIKTIDDWHIRNEMEITSDSLRSLRARINGFLNKGTRLSCLCKPVNVRI
jgi:hypothetical protein